MALSFLFIAFCLILGGVAAFALRGPTTSTGIAAGFKDAKLKRFSPKKTLFIIGSSANHPPCRLQRRLLKPAIAALIREDVAVVEVYGDDRPRKNGEEMDWLDASLLRHAMDAEHGFCVVYVDEEGKTGLRSNAPVVTADIVARIGVDLETPMMLSNDRRRSAVLKRLRAA